MKTTVLKCLLLDADVTIYLHEIGLWKAFIKRFEVFVSATVLNFLTFLRGIIEIGIYKLLSQTNLLDFQKLLWYIKA